MIPRRTFRHWLLLALLVAGVAVLSRLLVEGLLGFSWAESIEQILADPGLWSALWVLGLLGIDVLLPVPSSLVMILSGALFGVVGGAALSLAGSLIGNVVAFELARNFGHAAATRLVGEAELARMSGHLDRYGVIAVVVTRPVPVVMETLSVVAGLSTMRRSAFLLASLFGTVPVAIFYAAAGAWSRDAGVFAPAVIIALSGIAAAWGIARSRRSNHLGRLGGETVDERSP